MDGSELSAIASGFVALGLVFIAGAVPLGYRLQQGRRAAPGSRPISIHVAIGVATTAAAFGHGLVALMSLGSSRAIAAGNLPLAVGAGALLVLMAHVGIGLQLRDPKARKRPELRRKHLMTALTIAALALAHTVMLWTAG